MAAATNSNSAVAAMRADPEAVLLYSDKIVVNEAGEEFRLSEVRPDTAHAPTMDEMLARIWPITPSTVVMRRDAFDRAGGFCEQLISAEDIHFWLLMREQGHFIYLPEKLVRFTYGQLFPKVLNRDIGPDRHCRSDSRPLRHRAPTGWCRNFIRHRVRMIANAGVIEMSKRQHGRRAPMFHPRAEVRSDVSEELHANRANVLTRPNPSRAWGQSLPRIMHGRRSITSPCPRGGRRAPKERGGRGATPARSHSHTFRAAHRCSCCCLAADPCL